MKILLSIDSLNLGGKEKQFSLLIQKLKKNYNIILYIVVINEIKVFNEKLINADKVIILKKNKNNIIQYYCYLNNIVEEYSPDIFHCWDSLSYFLLLPIAKYKKIKIINGVIRYSKKPIRFSVEWMISKLFNFSDVIVANSYAGLYSHTLVPSSKIRVIYNGYDFENHNNYNNKHVIKGKYSIDTTYVIIMVANFIESKDYSTFIKAANIILEKKYSVTFLCIGKGKKISDYMHSINIVHKKHFCFIDNIDDPTDLINISDIGVLASNTINHSEGVPNALIEYMAQSKPVIATNIGGVKELVIDGENGFLVTGMNPQIMAEKMEFLITNRELAQKFGENGKNLILQKFNLAKTVAQYYNLYYELAGRK